MGRMQRENLKNKRKLSAHLEHCTQINGEGEREREREREREI